MVSLLLLTAAAFAALPSCGTTCRDADQDGRGDGCERGLDCDDRDPTRALRCVAAPARCRSDPRLEGCPCLAELDGRCYAAPAETLGVGVCRAGRADCAKGVVLECKGARLPSAEVCNNLDDDCDGVADERVASPCGDCDARCIGAVWGLPVEPFLVEEGLALTGAGELTLAQVTRDRSFVWIPNTDEGTLSKLDAERAVELARYRTPGGRPVRVAVDHRGDPWVLDRPSIGRARLAKMSSEPARCIDRDGDGVETSQRPDHVLDHDECWLLDVEVGEPGDGAHALAIDGAQAPDAELAGNAWVGLASAERVIAFDGHTGQPLTAAETPGFAPHTGSFDVWGNLWLLDRGGQLARIDPLQTPPSVQVQRVELACYTLESLHPEADGRLLFAGFGCENVASFDPRSGRWWDVRVPALLSPRGVARAAGAAWVVYTSGQLARIDRESLAVSQAFELASEGSAPFESLAVAADSSQRLWVVSTQGGPDGRGLATRFDPGLGTVTAQVPVGIGPRGGGDLTGAALGEEFVRAASTRHVFEGGCGIGGGTAANGTRWHMLHLSVRSGTGGSVELAVRWAQDRDGLAAVSFDEIGSYPGDGAMFPVQLPEGGVVEVQLTLRSRHAIGAPRIARVGMEWTCPGPD